MGVLISNCISTFFITSVMYVAMLFILGDYIPLVVVYGVAHNIV